MSVAVESGLAPSACRCADKALARRLTGLFRQRYCRAKCHECARMIVETAGLPVPEDLFPNQDRKAAEIIGAAVAHARSA